MKTAAHLPLAALCLWLCGMAHAATETTTASGPVAPDYYRKGSGWLDAIKASCAARETSGKTLAAAKPAAKPVPEAKNAKKNERPNDGYSNADWPFWERLMADYPAQRGLIFAAYDWCRQDKLDIFVPAARFEQKAKETLAQSRLVLASVVAAGGNAKLGDDLKALEARCATAGADWRQLYFDVHALRRRILLAHPALAFDSIIINRNPPTKYSHNGDQHLGRHSRIGPGLSRLTNWKSDNPTVTALFAGKLPEGATRNPDLHYDADRLVFSFCDHTATGEKRYFLYEGAVDGTWVKQLTGTRSDDFATWDNRATVLIEDNDPAYLPDGGLVFVSSRSQSYGRCHGGRYNPAMVLFKCDAKGGSIQQLSFGNENEYEPAVLNDGRIIFTRWEYTDRHEMLFHKLWHCRPDGSHVAHYYGNDSLAPMMTTEASAIPGTHKVVATSMGHHSYSTGTTVVLDIDKGENGEAPVTHITPETPYSETHGWPNPHYSHPYPITDSLFLVSRANHPVPPQGRLPQANDRGIYLIDALGSRELLYEEPTVASVSPIAVRKRQRPPVLPALQVPPGAAADMATVYVQNVYLTRNDPEGKIKPGAIKALRVNALGVQPRANRTPLLQNCPNGIPKKVLGTVPVDANGAACFTVPAQTALQMQILDENGMAILTEKSFFYLQPGERRSCIGCHEPVGSSPPPGYAMRSLTPVALTPPAGPQYKGGFSFMRTVQPVLDRHCISCHGLEQGKNNGASFVHDGKTWPQPYVEFVRRGEYRLGNKGYMGGEFNISRPYTFYAHSNSIIPLLLKGHAGVKLDRPSLDRIIQFLDLNAQCYGDLFPNKLEDRKFDGKALAELRAYIKELFGDKLAAQPERALVNTAQPDESRILMMPLAASAGGWGQIPGYQDRKDAKYVKMQQLVDKCIVRAPNENTNGWQPTPEQGGSEKWVLEEQQRFLQRLAATTK